jgi:hypothetical protein
VIIRLNPGSFGRNLQSEPYWSRVKFFKSMSDFHYILTSKSFIYYVHILYIFKLSPDTPMGFDLTTHNSAGRDDTTRAHPRVLYNTSKKVGLFLGQVEYFFKSLSVEKRRRVTWAPLRDLSSHGILMKTPLLSTDRPTSIRWFDRNVLTASTWDRCYGCQNIFKLIRFEKK